MQILRQHPEYPKVMKVCQTLAEKGFTAWLAGGCVRDGLLGRLPKDFDVVTDATPDQIESLFAKTVAVGKQFGIIVVVEDHAHIEVATFRSDGHYVDGRRPTSVEFSNPQEDSKRRDFTINAMFLDPLSNEVHDYVGGQLDLSQKIIRTVGEPKKRFEEDHLRILRAVRFVADLGFSLETQTLAEVVRLKEKVLTVSYERQRDELTKFLRSEHLSKGLDVLYETGLLELLLRLSKTQAKDVTQAFKKICMTDITEIGKWSVFFGLQGSELLFEESFVTSAAQRIDRLMAAFRFSNLEKQMAVSVMRALGNLNSTTSKAKILRMAAEPWNKDFYQLVLGLKKAQYLQPKNFAEFEKAILNDCTLPARFVMGEDLKNIGIKPSPRFGELLEKVYDLQLEGQLRSKAEALDWCKSNSVV